MKKIIKKFSQSSRHKSSTPQCFSAKSVTDRPLPDLPKPDPPTSDSLVPDPSISDLPTPALPNPEPPVPNLPLLTFPVAHSPLEPPLSEDPTLLWCVFSEPNPTLRSAFSVTTSPSETISELRERIWRENPYLCAHVDATDLVLCAPTIHISLTGADLFESQVSRLQGGRTFVEELTIRSTVVKSGLLPKISEEQLHLYIIIPCQPARSIGSELRNIQSVLNLLVNLVLLPPARKSITRPDNRPFKLDLYRYYHQPKAEVYPEQLACALTNVVMSSEAVVAAHLWPRSEGRSREWFGFRNIDNPRNGLLLYKPIEEEYDNYNLCFYRNKDGKLRCRIMMKSLRSKTFAESFRENKGKTTGISAKDVQLAMVKMKNAGFVTFGDLEKPEAFLRFPPSIAGPFKRVLNLQAIRAFNAAKERGETDLEHFDIGDYYSDDAHYGARVMMESWRSDIPKTIEDTYQDDYMYEPGADELD